MLIVLKRGYSMIILLLLLLQWIDVTLIAVLTVCVDMHPLNGTDGIYDTQQYLEHVNNSIDFDRW